MARQPLGQAECTRRRQVFEQGGQGSGLIRFGQERIEADDGIEAQVGRRGQLFVELLGCAVQDDGLLHGFQPLGHLGQRLGILFAPGQGIDPAFRRAPGGFPGEQATVRL